MRDGWTETTLGDAADVKMGQSPPGDTYNGRGDGLPFMQGSAEFGDRFPTPVKWCTTPVKVAEPGDLLLSVRAPVGDTNFADQRVAIGRGLACVRGTPRATTEFLALSIQSRTSDLLAASGTGMFTSITSKNLNGLSLMLPPMEEQKRIVDVVSSVDAYIDALKDKVEKARTARNAVLHELLSVGGPDWTETTLGKAADVKMGQSPPGDTYNGRGDGLPFMQGSAEFGDRFPTPVKWCTTPVKVAEPGDLLLSVRAPVGDTNFADQRVAIGRGLACVRGTLRATTEFLALSIQSKTSDLLAASGTGMFASITSKNLNGLSLVLPPMEEQKRIVDIITSMDDVITASEKALEEAKQLRSGLLSDLLSGEHEIPASYDLLLGAA